MVAILSRPNVLIYIMKHQPVQVYNNKIITYSTVSSCLSIWLIGSWEIWKNFQIRNFEANLSDWWQTSQNPLALGPEPEPVKTAEAQWLYCVPYCGGPAAWWHHQMETFSTLLALCAGNSPVTGEFPALRPVTRSFNVFFDLRLNKWLSKQLWGWWSETPSCPLWCHCNGLIKIRVGNHSIGNLMKIL